MYACMHIYIYVYMRTTNFKEKMSFCITIDLQTWEGQDTETFERLLRRVEHIISYLMPYASQSRFIVYGTLLSNSNKFVVISFAQLSTPFRENTKQVACNISSSRNNTKIGRRGDSEW